MSTKPPPHFHRAEEGARYDLPDEAAMARYPYRSPVPGEMLAELIYIIGDAGAEFVGLDVFRTDPTWERGDDNLASATRRNGRVVLGGGVTKAGDFLFDPLRAEVRQANSSHFIEQVYETDPLLCPQCGGSMRIIAFIEQPEVIDLPVPGTADREDPHPPGALARACARPPGGVPVAVFSATGRRSRANSATPDGDVVPSGAPLQALRGVVRPSSPRSHAPPILIVAPATLVGPNRVLA